MLLLPLCLALVQCIAASCLPCCWADCAAAPPRLPCCPLPQPGEYHFRFMVGDSTDLHPVMAVSDKYEREEIANREGQHVMCNKVTSKCCAVVQLCCECSC